MTQICRTTEKRLDIGVLHGFRVLMVFFVANFHIWQQGWLGQHFSWFGKIVSFDYWTRSSYLFVDGMILLSGFLLFLPHARQAAEGTSVDPTRRFYLKRAVRILPSYLAAVFLALFLVALPNHLYPTAQDMWKDILSHLTFTFLFSPQTYIFTPLNVALWTIAVEVQFYLIFPLLAAAAKKQPALTLSVMTLVGWGFRFCVSRYVNDTAMWMNQMPAFLDVYALGMLGAMVFVWLHREMPKMDKKLRCALEGVFTVLVVLGCMALSWILKTQSAAGAVSPENLRLSQMNMRVPVTLVLMTMMLAASQMPWFLQKIFDNKLMRFLAEISMNFYIWHQILAVQMRRKWFDTEMLHHTIGQQKAFTVLCYAVALVVAMMATYGLEKPISGWVRKYQKQKKANQDGDTGHNC